MEQQVEDVNVITGLTLRVTNGLVTVVKGNTNYKPTYSAYTAVMDNLGDKATTIDAGTIKAVSVALDILLEIQLESFDMFGCFDYASVLDADIKQCDGNGCLSVALLECLKAYRSLLNDTTTYIKG